MVIEVVLAHAVVLEVDHPSPDRWSEVNPKERRMGAIGGVVVDLIAIAEDLHVRKGSGRMQEVPSHSFRDDLDRIGNTRPHVPIVLIRLEVDVLDLSHDRVDLLEPTSRRSTVRFVARPVSTSRNPSFSPFW